jgi:hypothetical protein
MNDNDLNALLDDVARSGIATGEALKGLKPTAENGGDPDASASDDGQGGDPEASASDETPTGEGSPEDSDEALKAVAVDADDLLDCIRDIVTTEVAKAIAGMSETLKGLVGASAAQIGISRNALEIGLHNAETLKSMATTPAAEPRRPGAAVSSRLPPPRDIPGAGGELTAAEVNKAINLKLINPVVGQQVLTAIQNSKPLPGEIDVVGLRERIAAAAAK